MPLFVNFNSHASDISFFNQTFHAAAENLGDAIEVIAGYMRQKYWL